MGRCEGEELGLRARSPSRDGLMNGMKDTHCCLQQAKIIPMIHFKVLHKDRQKTNKLQKQAHKRKRRTYFAPQ